jgi:PKD repeat protein
LKNQSNPENSPPVAQSGPVGISAGTGGGGIPEVAFFDRTIVATFETSPNAVAAAGATVTFANGSSKYVDVLWGFGDNIYSSGYKVTHKFTSTGSFTVSVTASNQSSSSVFSASVPALTPHFTATPLTANAPVSISFSNTSTSDSLLPMNYLWLFGAKSTSGSIGAAVIESSSLASPTFVFYNTGSFTITLQASSSFDAVAVTSSTNLISASVPMPAASFTVTPSSGVVPFTAVFTNTSTNASQYLWLFGSGSGPDGGQEASSSAVNPTFVYTQGTLQYTVQLQASGSWRKYTITSSTNYISASA